MSLLSNILDVILKNPVLQQGTADATAPTTPVADTPPPTPTAPAGTGTAGAQAPQQAVDVAAVLDHLASQSGEKLDWRHSVVDLLKAIGHDSSRDARTKLAQELNFKGDKNNTAQMNEFVHDALLEELRTHGGKLPDDL